MMLYSLILLLFFLIYDAEQIEKSLASKSVELTSTLPGTENSDLQQLAPFLKGRRIISLGEASHGTSEFFTMKHRLLEHLVKEQGFRIFAIENNFTSTLALNDYVLEGKGDPNELLNSNFMWVWNTEEVLALVKWMRSYNLTCKPKDKVKFYGFDMQTSYKALQSLKSFVKDIDPKLHTSLESSYPPIADSINQVLYLADSLDIVKIKNSLAQNKNMYVKASSLKTWQLQDQNANIIQQHYTRMQFYKKFIDKTLPNNVRIKNHHATYKQREISMAANVKWILDHEGENSKIVLWAHNAHISEGGDLFMRDVQPMGSYLSQWYKEQYYSVGFDTYEGKYNWVKDNKRQAIAWSVASPDYFAFTAEKIDRPIFFLDFQNASQDKILKDWLDSSLTIRDHSRDHKGSIRSYFDGIIFIRSTNPSKLL